MNSQPPTAEQPQSNSPTADSRQPSDAAPRYILRRTTDQQYFCAPHGPDNREWSDNSRDAWSWVDLDSCLAAARTWKLIHNLDLEVLQRGIGPHHCSVTAPGTPQLTVSHG